jgi:hypothetical protein
VDRKGTEESPAEVRIGFLIYDLRFMICRRYREEFCRVSGLKTES